MLCNVQTWLQAIRVIIGTDGPDAPSQTTLGPLQPLLGQPMPTVQLQYGLLTFGAGAAFGAAAVGIWLARRHGIWRPRLPAPTECPSAGVVAVGKINPERLPKLWIFFGNHFVNLDFYNASMADDDPLKMLHHSYPARLHASAGYMRAWGTRGERLVGDQTITNLTYVGAESGRAHAIVGCLVPFTDDSGLRNIIRTQLEAVSMSQFDWLGWTDPPPGVETVQVFAFELQNFKPPTVELPILQSHVDVLVEGALKHGAAFAAEWLDSIQWWTDHDDEGRVFYLNDREQARRPWLKTPLARKIDDVLASHPDNLRILSHRAHMNSYHHGVPPSNPPHANELAKPRRGSEALPPPPLAERRVVRNFIFGFGSIIQTASRSGTDPSVRDAAPCRISAAWGYVREWNFQASTAQICALGLRRVRPGEVGATINGVCFPAPDDLTEFDCRENGYCRVPVATHLVVMLSWHVLPPDANVFVYVPYAPAVVSKYGCDPRTGLTKCSGACGPEGLLPSEAPGLGLQPPSISYPILQTYVDVCLSGCLEYGDEFAREFIQTTFLWSPYWLNERELARRPWLHQKQYNKIDTLLREGVGSVFAHRKLESEYAVLYHH